MTSVGVSRLRAAPAPHMIGLLALHQRLDHLGSGQLHQTRNQVLPGSTPPDIKRSNSSRINIDGGILLIGLNLLHRFDDNTDMVARANPFTENLSRHHRTLRSVLDGGDAGGKALRHADPDAAVDVVGELVTVEHAREIYKVAIDVETMTIDEGETAVLRQAELPGGGGDKGLGRRVSP